MKKRIKKKWVDALRSGEYRKIKGALTSGPKSYCVMGVLGKVMGLQPIEGGVLAHGEGENRATYDGSFDSRVLKAAGLTLEQQSEMIGLNDGTSKSFKELADIIEAEL